MQGGPLMKLLLWPLRKVAVIPAVTIGGFFFAAYLGSAELSATATRAILGGSVKKEDAKPGTELVATTGALSLSGALVVVREYFFRPKVVPSPEMPANAAGLAYARARAGIWAHYLRHYPYVYRAKTIFAAGSLAGVCYAVIENRWNSGGNRGAAHPSTRGGEAKAGAGGGGAAAAHHDAHAAHARSPTHPPSSSSSTSSLSSSMAASAHALAAATSVASAAMDDLSHHHEAGHGITAGGAKKSAASSSTSHPHSHDANEQQEFSPQETALRLTQAITALDRSRS